jgi:hypothetical protein
MSLKILWNRMPTDGALNPPNLRRKINRMEAVGLKYMQDFALGWNPSDATVNPVVLRSRQAGSAHSSGKSPWPRLYPRNPSTHVCAELIVFGAESCAQCRFLIAQHKSVHHQPSAQAVFQNVQAAKEQALSQDQ